jgi:glycosyltransferase involved in cell wall biosynthesis
MPQISVVIPVLDESSILRELLQRVVLNLESITSNFEIIIVDDGSKDETWAELRGYSIGESRVKGIKLSRNFGHHHAISAGLKKSKGDWVVVMDGDLQDRPENIPLLFQEALKGFEIVFIRRTNRPESYVYKFFQKCYYIILNFLTGLNLDSREANFSIISRKVVQAFNEFPDTARFYGSTIKWLGFKRGFVYADHGKRFGGNSSYTLSKRIKLAADIIVAFSDRPLKLSIYFGFFISLISIFLFFAVLLRAVFLSYDVQGWTSIIISIFFSTGSLLMVLGVHGTYVGRIFDQVKNRSLYIIDEQINLGELDHNYGK